MAADDDAESAVTVAPVELPAARVTASLLTDIEPVVLKAAAAQRFMRVVREGGGDGEGDGRWRLVRSGSDRPDGPWEVVNEQTFVRTDEGHVALAEEINHDEGVELVFDPPMVVMPAELEPGAEFEQQTFLKVHPIGDRSKTKAQGQVRQTVRHTGAALARMSVGQRPAQRIRQTFRAALKPAEVVNVTRQWFVPGEGLIAETRQEHTTVLGVPTRNNREEWVLFEPGPS